MTAMSSWHWRPPWLCGLPAWATCLPTWPRSGDTATADAEDEDVDSLGPSLAPASNCGQISIGFRPGGARSAWLSGAGPGRPPSPPRRDWPLPRPLLAGRGVRRRRPRPGPIRPARARCNADDALLYDGLERLFPDDPTGRPIQRRAPPRSAGHFSVIAGGPGTGKTTTVAPACWPCSTNRRLPSAVGLL